MKKILLFMCALICSAAMSAATWNVTVPDGTKACYIAGEATGWKHTEMTKVDATHYTITIETDKKDKYKYCSGPDWAYVEKTADGGDVLDRTYRTDDVVAAWASIYDPGATVSYVDITIRVKAATAPTIWWWGAGDKCPNPEDVPGMGYNFKTNQPVMTVVEGKTGWYEWNFKDVNESLGVTFKLNKGNNEINAKESTCYNTSGEVIDCDNDDPVVTYDYYIAGNEALTGKNWVADGTGMNKVDGIYTYTFSNVAANTQCALKVTDGTWADGKQWGYDQLSTVPAGVTLGKNNNIIFTLAEAGDVTVQFNAETKKVTLIGTFNGGDEPATPKVQLAGDFETSEWSTYDLTTSADKLTAYVVLTLEKRETAENQYSFKMIVDGEWFGNEWYMERNNCTGWVLEKGKGNVNLRTDVAGNYTFTWTYANNSLSVTYPMAGPTSISSTEAEVVTTKVIRDGQVLIIRDGVVYNMMGQAIR